MFSSTRSQINGGSAGPSGVGVVTKGDCVRGRVESASVAKARKDAGACHVKKTTAWFFAELCDTAGVRANLLPPRNTLEQRHWIDAKRLSQHNEIDQLHRAAAVLHVDDLTVGQAESLGQLLPT
jgi:hypothetical protein